MLSHLLSSLLYFVTDCDGTLCHYPHDHAYNVTSDDLLDLPPSAGSGAMAVMYVRTHTMHSSCFEPTTYNTMRHSRPYRTAGLRERLAC
jgi:hypothetical protein